MPSDIQAPGGQHSSSDRVSTTKRHISDSQTDVAAICVLSEEATDVEKNSSGAHQGRIGAATDNTAFQGEAGAVRGAIVESSESDLSEPGRFVHYTGIAVREATTIIWSALVAVASRSGGLLATLSSTSTSSSASDSNTIDEGIPMEGLSINTVVADSGIHGVMPNSAPSPDLERQSSTTLTESELWSATVWKRRLLTVVVIMVVSSLMYTAQLVVVSKINGGHTIQFCTSTGCEIGVPPTQDLDRRLATTEERIH